MFCTQCGKQVDQGKNFCGNCGARVNMATEPIPSSPVEEIQPTLASTPAQKAPRAESEERSAPGARPAAISPIRERRGINTALIISVVLVLIIAAGTSLYFGTDLLRRPVKQEPVAVEQARVAPQAPPGTVEEPKVASETNDSNLASAVQPPESAPQAPMGASKPAPELARAPKVDVPAGSTKSQQPRPSSASQRAANPGIYEVRRATSVFEGPSGSSRVLASIPAGTRVNVVNSNGDWLEVHSKSGNPPGFIRRDDATFVEKSN
jgi:hypothetical protein